MCFLGNGRHGCDCCTDPSPSSCMVSSGLPSRGLLLTACVLGGRDTCPLRKTSLNYGKQQQGMVMVTNCIS